MPRSVDFTVGSTATVEQIHRAFAEEAYWHARLAAFGGMASIQVRGGREAALGVASRVKLFTRATSLGSVESLIEHRASVEWPDTRTPDNLLRLSIGLEHPDDLIEDLAEALKG